MSRYVLILLVVCAGVVSGCSDVPSVSPTAPEYKQPAGPKPAGPKSQFE